uniref:Transmembrane protein n=1 Tax=Ananas comosus var. bracteatus TaxID=296719 RepID=A0A6V7QFR0_ANACO|nr:unnamed protein product [Ananas comosus var. bracteatus]
MLSEARSLPCFQLVFDVATFESSIGSVKFDLEGRCCKYSPHQLYAWPKLLYKTCTPFLLLPAKQIKPTAPETKILKNIAMKLMDRHRRSMLFVVVRIATVLCLLLSGLSPVYAPKNPARSPSGPSSIGPNGKPISFTPVPGDDPPNPPSKTPFLPGPIVTRPPRQQKP